MGTTRRNSLMLMRDNMANFIKNSLLMHNLMLWIYRLRSRVKWDRRASQGSSSKKQNIVLRTSDKKVERKGIQWRKVPWNKKVDLGFQSSYQEMGITALSTPSGQSWWRKNRLEAIVLCDDSRTGNREQLNADAHHMSIRSYCPLEI